jgi:hypothetical protein
MTDQPRAAMDLRRPSPGLPDRFDQVEQRQVAFGKVRHLGRPIVHLHIDVGVVIAVQGVWIPSAQRPCRFAARSPGRLLEISRYRPNWK